MALHKGSTKRLLINLPPRHLKTEVGSVCFAAWLLAHQPNIKILLVTYSGRLAREIAHSARAILRSSWFRKAFDTRIAKDYATVDNFRTTVGGQLYAASFDGTVTGFGADYIIVDDAHNLKDACFPGNIQKTVDRFYNIIINRLNKPGKGRIAVIGHRVHQRLGPLPPLSSPMVVGSTSHFQ